ncbi:hypothetical protein HHK36_029534 [Tetracentron sinense]|uniref:Glyoxal oxidase n=1 Tax=Tetracentron sinense TaxID=13715 RepID=A0A834YDV1_TETSI|nr:hypothetical protein HHK36_029534 [Tetracentron sinense]
MKRLFLSIVSRFPIITILFLSLQWVTSSTAIGGVSGGEKGEWQILLNNTGVVAMHMALTHHNTVLIFDQTGSGRSGYQLRRGYDGKRCFDSSDDSRVSSCYAHSVEYNIAGNKVRPLRLETDTWCSSGSFLSNGTLLQTGGYGNGYRRIRYFRPCDGDNCDWRQSRALLSDNRWYASNHILPEKDRVIVVGGRRIFTYEFVPKLSSGARSFDLPFLHQTNDGNEGGNNLYPFLHLSSDGNLFIFANRDSILFNYKRNKVIKTFPRIPGEGSRNYPSTGSSVILPLDHTDGFQKVEVMVCGGAASGAYRAARQGNFLKGLSSCGRMVITGNRHKWAMENMPEPRMLNDMLILPNGHVLIINGAKNGCAGWNNAANPSLRPYLYKPKKIPGRRFSVLKSTKIARMYHSSAVLLPDGRVLVAGGNPNNRYTFNNVAYPTELRLQAFVPHYMGRDYHDRRPGNVSIHYGKGEYGVRYGEEFTVNFWLGTRPSNDVEFSAYAPPFTTHSVSMNQRMLRLRCKNMVREEDGWMNAVLEAPPSPNVAPSGYYMLTVVNGGIPNLQKRNKRQPISPFFTNSSGVSLVSSETTMYATEMVSTSRFSYQRLRNEGGLDKEEDLEGRAFGRTRSWTRLRKMASRKRSKIRIPGLRRFLRRKARMFSTVRVSLGRVLKRLKDSQSHMGDLFAGNYLFMQVSPSPLKFIEKSVMGQNLHGFSSSYSVGRIA